MDTFSQIKEEKGLELILNNNLSPENMTLNELRDFSRNLIKLQKFEDNLPKKNIEE